MQIITTQSVDFQNDTSTTLWVKRIKRTCPFPEIKVFLTDNNKLSIDNIAQTTDENDIEAYYIGSIYNYGLGDSLSAETDPDTLLAKGHVVPGGLSDFDVMLDISRAKQQLTNPGKGVLVFVVERSNIDATDIATQNDFTYKQITIE